MFFKEIKKNCQVIMTANCVIIVLILFLNCKKIVKKFNQGKWQIHTKALQVGHFGLHFLVRLLFLFKLIIERREQHFNVSISKINVMMTIEIVFKPPTSLFATDSEILKAALNNCSANSNPII